MTMSVLFNALFGVGGVKSALALGANTNVHRYQYRSSFSNIYSSAFISTSTSKTSTTTNASCLRMNHRSNSNSFQLFPTSLSKVQLQQQLHSRLWKNNNNNNIYSTNNSFRNFATYASSTAESESEKQIDNNNNNNLQEEEEILLENNSHEFDIILDGLNDAQVEAVTQPSQSITRVVAGPGAGKTRVLTCRIAYLLKRDSLVGDGGSNSSDGGNGGGYSNSRILAVTFTKKASTEMQHRLNTLLVEDEEYQKKFTYEEEAENEQDDDNDNDNDNDGDDIIEEVAPSIPNNNKENNRAVPILTSRVTLGTFHSVCAKILRWHGNELDKIPALQQYLPRTTRSNNDNASEGSTGGGGKALDGSFAIIDQTEQMRIIKQCLTECGIDLKGSGTRGQADIRPITILNAVGQLKSDEAMGIMFNNDNNNDERSNGIKMSKKVRAIATEVYPKYRKVLLSQNSLDFDDLILMTRELLKTNIDARTRMQRRWRHILVDEFQDTSEVQLDLVKLLSTSSLLIVGDGDQSIYSWRGAHAESMSDFVKEFNERSDGIQQDGVNTVFLMENYR